MDMTLTSNDAGKIMEELVEAQNHANLLGLMLNVKPDDVEAIEATYQNPKQRLLHVIIKFLEQADQSPTWKAIVQALRTRTVDLPRLAARLEERYVPNTSRPPTAIGKSACTSPGTFWC